MWHTIPLVCNSGYKEVKVEIHAVLLLLFILKIGFVIKLLFGLDIIHPVKKLTLYSLCVVYLDEQIFELRKNVLNFEAKLSVEHQLSLWYWCGHIAHTLKTVTFTLSCLKHKLPPLVL